MTSDAIDAIQRDALELMRELNEYAQRHYRSQPACTCDLMSICTRLYSALIKKLGAHHEWADGFSDRQLEERRTGEEYQRELRAALVRAHAVIRKCVTAGVLRADLNRFLADEAHYAGPSDSISEVKP